MSYAAQVLLKDLTDRGFREPQYEESGFIITHDPCGFDLWFSDWTPPEIIDRETLDHALTCTAPVPIRSLP